MHGNISARQRHLVLATSRGSVRLKKICRAKSDHSGAAICADQYRGIFFHRNGAGGFGWKGEGGDDYTLSVNAGQVSAAGSSHGVY
jgi:hypothetical protein